MNDYISIQEDNRRKADKAFNDFLDCFVQADSRYKNAIGSDLIKIMTVKANADDEVNKQIGWALEVLANIGRR